MFVFLVFLEGLLAKTSLPNVYLMKYFSALWLRLWWDSSQGLCFVLRKKVNCINWRLNQVIFSSSVPQKCFLCGFVFVPVATHDGKGNLDNRKMLFGWKHWLHIYPFPLKKKKRFYHANRTGMNNIWGMFNSQPSAAHAAPSDSYTWLSGRFLKGILAFMLKPPNQPLCKSWLVKYKTHLLLHAEDGNG